MSNAARNFRWNPFDVRRRQKAQAEEAVGHEAHPDMVNRPTQSETPTQASEEITMNVNDNVHTLNEKAKAADAKDDTIKVEDNGNTVKVEAKVKSTTMRRILVGTGVVIGGVAVGTATYLAVKALRSAGVDTSEAGAVVTEAVAEAASDVAAAASEAVAAFVRG